MVYLILIIGLYTAYCGLLYFNQTKLIFPAAFAGRPGAALPTMTTQTIELETEQGKTVAWFVPAPGSGNDADQPKPLAVFLHGNAELIDHQGPAIDLYHALGVSVLLVEYRGYGHSQGTPSQKHIVADTLAILHQVLERDEVDAARLILHGRSIGGGLATQVALQTSPIALIVESTGTSVAGMAWRYGAPPFLVTSPLRTQLAFKKLDCPILIMHGRNDDIFPLHHAHTLQKAGKQTTLVLFDAEHNTLPGPGQEKLYQASVAEHLRRAGVIGEGQGPSSLRGSIAP